MAPKYIAFFVFLFVVGSILGLIIEDGILGVGQQSTLNNLLIWQQIGSEETWGTWDWITFVPNFFGALWKTATWNFSFLTGSWIYIKWIIWTPLMAMFIWGLVLSFLAIFQKALS